MKLTFLGAARTVTGSCSMLEVGNTRILVDCGMFQGRAKEEAMNEQPLPVSPSEIDYVLLTHAHIDHSGRIPWLYVNGFKGEVIAQKQLLTYAVCCFPTWATYRNLKQNGKTENE